MTMKPHCKSAGGGFTLLELLCVIAIIAMLLGLIVGAVVMARSKANMLVKDIGKGQTNIVQMEEPGGLLSPD